MTTRVMNPLESRRLQKCGCCGSQGHSVRNCNSGWIQRTHEKAIHEFTLEKRYGYIYDNTRWIHITTAHEVTCMMCWFGISSSRWRMIEKRTFLIQVYTQIVNYNENERTSLIIADIVIRAENAMRTSIRRRQAIASGLMRVLRENQHETVDGFMRVLREHQHIPSPRPQPQPYSFNIQIVMDISHEDEDEDAESREKEEDCPICYDSIKKSDMLVTNCKHSFCSNCIKKHLVSTIVGRTPCCAMCRTNISSFSVKEKGIFDNMNHCMQRMVVVQPIN